MKKLLIILLLSPCFLKAQVDTLGTISRWQRAGVFNMDTIKVSNNSTSQFVLALKGGTAKAIKIVTISNTNNKYKIVSNLTPVTFTGLTSGKFEVILINNFVAAKITGTSKIIPWELITLIYKDK